MSETWLKFDSEYDEEPSHEANLFKTELGYTVEWYHVSVGQITHAEFDTIDEARTWLEEKGFADFTA